MWKIHGKTYDLEKYMETDSHPGGQQILVLTKNMDDLTPLFETYHAFSANREKILQTLAKYEIQNTVGTPTFQFDSYHRLLDKVKNTFPSRESVKADARWTIQAIYTALLFAFFAKLAFFSQYSLFIRTISAIIAGGINNSIGFNILHDASHYAISKNPKINEFLSKITNSFVLWNPILWFYHHVYAHHSFTGIEKKDPDLYYYYPFMTKTSNKKGVEFTLKNQEIAGPFLIFFIPGLYTGQIIAYVNAILKNKYMILSLPKRAYYDTTDLVIIFLKLWLIIAGGFWTGLCYHLSSNFFYAINIIGDHDTMNAGVKNHYDPNENARDWLKLQIHNSSNFVNSNLVWTFLFGGINYQIEHHLFPNVSHIHYPTIAPIVKKYCAENDIPYSHYDSLWSVLVSHIQLLSFFKKDNSREKKE